jgi:uncharacterized membrane protein
LQFVRRALSLPIQNETLFARKSRPDHAERFVMKRYLPLLLIVIAALASSSLLAQEKAALQPNATVLSVLQGSVGKTVELRMNCGEKIGGKVEQVNDNLVLLSHLTGAEYFDGFVNIKDISAVVIRSAGK